MKITVVIPAYNEELFLGRTLESLQNQTRKPNEIIVVDNNSTDKTAAIAKSFGAKVVKEKNLGYAYACNRGFAEANGDIIARADADYVLPKKWLATIEKSFNKDKELIAVGGPLYPLESTWFENIIYFPALPIWMNILKALGRGFLFPNMAVKKAAYKRCGGFDTNIVIGEDTDLCLRLVKTGKVKLQTNLYVYTSTRKLRHLGFFKTVFGYSIWNQILMGFGKEATIGADVVRDIPKMTANPQNPFIFLYVTPSIVALLLLVIVAQFSTPNLPEPAQSYTKKLSITPVQISDAMQQPLNTLKKTLIRSELMFQPLKSL